MSGPIIITGEDILGTFEAVIERAFLHPGVPAEGSTIDPANLVDTTQRIAEGLFAIAESIDRLAEANQGRAGESRS